MNIEEASSILYGNLLKKKVKCYVGYEINTKDESLGTIQVMLYQEKVPKLPAKFEGYPIHIIQQKTK